MMKLYGLLSDLRNSLMLRSALRQGLVLGNNVRIMGRPDFGTEPYLIEIGDDVTISSEVSFLTHDGATWVFRNRPEYKGLQFFGRIKVGNNCFVGHRATIMPGVCIGDNCVIGTGAVVTGSVPDDSVVAGVPARVVRSYQDYVARTAPLCRYYPPSVANDADKLRSVLLSEHLQPWRDALPLPEIEVKSSPPRIWSLLFEPPTLALALSEVLKL